MTQNTDTTIEKTIEETTDTAAVVTSRMAQDLRTSVLILSVVFNLFILTAWLALQVTTQFDAQIANLLFNR